MKSSPRLPQLEKALAQKRRPNVAIDQSIKKTNLKKKKRKQTKKIIIEITRSETSVVNRRWQPPSAWGAGVSKDGMSGNAKCVRRAWSFSVRLIHLKSQLSPSPTGLYTHSQSGWNCHIWTKRKEAALPFVSGSCTLLSIKRDHKLLSNSAPSVSTDAG